MSIGYYVSPGDEILVNAEVVNLTNDTKTIYALIDIEYVPGKAKLEASPVTLSVGQCDGGGIGLTPTEGAKKWNLESKPMTIQSDGYIFAIRKYLPPQALWSPAYHK